MDPSEINRCEQDIGLAFTQIGVKYPQPVLLAGLASLVSRVWVGSIMLGKHEHTDLFEGFLGDASAKARKAHEIFFNEEISSEQKLWDSSFIMYPKEELSSPQRMELCLQFLQTMLKLPPESDDDDFYTSQIRESFQESAEKLQEIANASDE